MAAPIQREQQVQTFAIPDTAPVQAQSNLQATPLGTPTLPQVAANISGGAVDASGSARTIDALMKLGGDALAPFVKQAAQEQFMAGVQKAMTGQALTEILDERPWYSDIFGPSNAAQGARFYASQAAVAGFSARVSEAMPELAKQSPETMRQYAVGAMQQFLTGDADADAIITNEVTQSFAPLFKQHAKEHYAWQQKGAANAMVRSIVAGGDLMQSQLSQFYGKGLYKGDIQQDEFKFMERLVKPAGMSDEAYERIVLTAVQESAAKGNFHVVKLLRDKGAFDAVDPEKRMALENSLRSAGTKALAGQVPAFAERIARTYLDVNQTPTELLTKVTAINAEAAAQTGVTEAQLIPESNFDNLVQSLLQRQQSLSQHQAAQLAKATKEAEEFNLARALLMQGGLGVAVKTGQVPAQIGQQAATANWVEAGPDPAKRAAVLNASGDFKLGVGDQLFSNFLSGKEYNDSFGHAFQVWSKMDTQARATYLDAGQQAQMLKFEELRQSGIPEAQAYILGRAATLVRPQVDDPTGKRGEAVADAVRSKYAAWFDFKTDLTPAARRMAQAVTARSMGILSANSPDLAKAAEFAVNEAERKGLHVLDKHAYLAFDPAADPLNRVIGYAPAETAKAFDQVLTETAAGQGVKALNDYSIYRVEDTKDRNGRATSALFTVEAFDGDGNRHVWSLTSDAIKARARANSGGGRSAGGSIP